MKSQLSYFFTLAVAPIIGLVTADPTSSCKLANGDLHRSELGDSSKKMWSRYEEVCYDANLCSATVEDVPIITNIDYPTLKEDAEWVQLRRACKALEDSGTVGTTMCRVTSRFTASSGGEKFDFYIKKEPVCFAEMCDEGDVDIVDPHPFSCDPSRYNCELLSIKADCPNPEDRVSSRTKCKENQNIIDNDADYQAAKRALEAKAAAACDKENPDTSVCVVENDDNAKVKMMLSESFRAFEVDPSYSEYMNSCYDHGGQTCYLSLTMRLIGQIVIYDLDVTGDYNDFPACFPAECDMESKEAILKERLAEKMADQMSELLIDRRSLREGDAPFPLDKAAISRILQNSGDGEACALGLEHCEAVVNDFYCTGADGTEINMLGSGYKSTSSGSTPAEYSFLAGVGAIGGIAALL